MNLRQAVALFDHPLGVKHDDLSANRAVYGLADLEKQVRWLARSPHLGHERRIGCHAIDQAGFRGAADLCDVCRIEKNFHWVTYS